jgi:uncharacterized DUF497 family protein
MSAAALRAGRSGKRPNVSIQPGRRPPNRLADLDIVSTESKWRFDWDPAKSAHNEAKHGLSLAAATALWAGPVLTLPSNRPGEMRHLAIGLIGGRHWTVVYTLRADQLRLISARPSRDYEKALLSNQDHGSQP